MARGTKETCQLCQSLENGLYTNDENVWRQKHPVDKPLIETQLLMEPVYLMNELFFSEA